MPTDLLIRNGRVIDPLQGIDQVMDVAIAGGRIAALGMNLAESEAAQTLDASGKLVCPGLIDLHTHVARDLVSLAVDPDQAGVLAGVTTVNDAGSVGYLHLLPFRKYAIAPAQTDVFVFLNVSPFGQAALPEIGFEIVDEAAFLTVIEANRDVVRGVKLRAVGELLYAARRDALPLAARIARQAGLPLMIHLGMKFNEPFPADEINAFITRLLGMLEKGDILTHAFTDKPGGVFRSDGTPLPGLEAALGRGVLLDAAPGRSHLNFNLARAALQRGFIPQAFGTDVIQQPEELPHFFNLAAIASKFMALGLSLRQALAAITCNPARMLNEQERRGSLQAGRQADLSILDYREGEFLFHDGRAGNTLPGQVFLSPQFTVKNGAPIAVRENYRVHLPAEDSSASIPSR